MRSWIRVIIRMIWTITGIRLAIRLTSQERSSMGVGMAPA